MIDSLTHFTPDGKWFHTDHDARVETLLGEMDEEGVSKSVVVALADHIDSEFVLSECRKRPDRLLPGASFNPSNYATSAEAVAAFSKEVKNKGYSVLKLHPRLGGYDPMDDRCIAVLEEIASWEKPIPVWLDTFFHGTVPLSLGPIETIHSWVIRFPKIKFVLLHSTGSQIMALFDAIRAFPNAYLDLSFTINRYIGSSVMQDIQYLIRHFDRRLTLGSDFPEMKFKETMERFNSLSEGISEEKRNNILFKNLETILQL